MTTIRTKLAEWFEACFATVDIDSDALLSEWSGCEHVDTYGDGRLWVERDGVSHWLDDTTSKAFYDWATVTV